MPTLQRHPVSIRALADAASIRTETFLGRDFLVVPVVALVEGVVQGLNAQTPELALATEFGRVPDGWNGRPIVMNHPVINGSLVSAGSPAAVEAFQFGWIFNSRIEDNKLKLEAWIDPLRVETLGGEVQTTVDRINEGTVVEVSTGLFCGVEEVQGKFNGQDYGAIWRDVVPDHLAFLSEGSIGACSIEDGCGTPRVNTSLRVHESAQKWQECGCKHSSGGSEMADNATTQDDEDKKDDKKGKMLNNAGFTPEFDIVRFQANASSEMLDTDVRKLVSSALSSMIGDYIYVIGVNSTTVVYETYDYNTGMYKTYQRSYTIGESNAVTLNADVQEVTVTMQVTPVAKANAGDSTMADTVTNAATTETTQSSAVAPAVTPTPAPVVNAAPQVRTLEQYIADAPPVIQAVLNEGMKMLNQKREGLIRSLKSTNRCKFTDEQLNAMSLDVLESLTDLAAVPQYTGVNPGPSSVEQPSLAANAAPTMPPLIPARAAS